MYWKVEYIVLILASTFIDYFVGKKIYSSESKNQKKKFLFVSLGLNLGLLFFFKYFNFLNSSLRDLFTFYNLDYQVSNLDVLLPVGISFYTFQTLSYTLDIYYGKTKPEESFNVFALYVSYFPQLVAGPIERPDHLLGQLKKEVKFNYDDFRKGLYLMGMGFFKKVVLADRLAIVVNQVYGNSEEQSWMMLLIGTYFFAYQIYYDFSGYSDIARGIARIVGVDLILNFNQPYLSKSISEFWRRWHISLSTWFRDYLYIPLGGNRVSFFRLQLNLLIVFLVSGLWHGANWTFVAWGAIHGFYLIFENIFKLKVNLSENIFIKSAKQILVFHLACFAWIYFRSENISHANQIVASLFTFKGNGLDLGFFGNTNLLIAIVGTAFIEILEFNVLNNSLFEKILTLNVFFRWLIYFVFILGTLTFGVFGNEQFIYFQF